MTALLALFVLHKSTHGLFGVHVQSEPLITIPVMLGLAVRDALTAIRRLLRLVVFRHDMTVHRDTFI